MIDTEKRRYLGLGAALLFAVFSVTPAGTQDRSTNKPRVDIQNMFTPSGWMGDGEYGRTYIDFSGADRSNPHMRPDSIRITYKFGHTRWGGIYWQNQPDNWGDVPGNNYSGKGFSMVTFWARGQNGGEVLEFKVGGIDNRHKKYRDSLAATSGRVALTRDWKLYTIDLSKADFSSVIGGFCWVASSDYNRSKQITFFLDDLLME